MNQQKILVLRSNIATSDDVTQLRVKLDMHPDINNWNVDLHDCDRVLRIETVSLTVHDIQSIISEHGYKCEELDN